MGKFHSWWDRLSVTAKDWAIVLLLSVPLIGVLAVHLSLVQQLRSIQESHLQVFLAADQVQTLSRLAVDIEDAFRGYIISEQELFLEPLIEAEAKLEATVAAAVALTQDLPGVREDVERATQTLGEFVRSKHQLIEELRRGHVDAVLKYVRSGKGMALSNALRRDFRGIKDRLDRHLVTFKAEEEKLTKWAFWGLLGAVLAGLVLGGFTLRVMRRFISRPLAVLQASVARLAERSESVAEPVSIPVSSMDEIGQLARSCEEMILRIQRHIRELEAIGAIGQEINSIGPDGLDGVLRRITDRAAEMLQADACLVMLREEKMGCWIIEAASGEWHEKLQKSVMLWDELPVSVQAFETREPAFWTDRRETLRSDESPRDLIMAHSMMALPLLSHGESFGVLALLVDRTIPRKVWNVRLAKGFAGEAAIAIANARLYEAAQRRGKGLESRLQYLEHLAEVMAHDLKAPGERMEVLASMVLAEYQDRLDERATRWLSLIQQNGQALSQHVKDILELARFGSVQEAMEAVDPAPVIHGVLNARAAELQQHNVRVQMAMTVFKVPCHRAYLRQVFDNLISNAIKFSAAHPEPRIQIIAKRCGDMIHFSVSDNGCGIPAKDRERVFQPFVRLDTSIKGSGIGLAIVKRIVEFYQGRIWIDDSSERGCTITFSLPVLAVEALQHDAPGSETAADVKNKKSSRPF